MLFIDNVIGAWFGSLLNGQITDRMGRKHSMIVAVVIFILGTSLQTAGISVSMIFAGRAVAGLSVGMLTMVVPLYMAEVSYFFFFLGNIVQIINN